MTARSLVYEVPAKVKIVLGIDDFVEGKVYVKWYGGVVLLAVEIVVVSVWA